MVSRRRRQFLESDTAALMTAIGTCRLACIAALRQAPPNDLIAERTRKLMNAINGVAEALTGDREHFWLKPHGGPKL